MNNDETDAFDTGKPSISYMVSEGMRESYSSWGPVDAPEDVQHETANALRAVLEEIATLVEREPDEERRRFWFSNMSPDEYDFERGMWYAVQIARKALARGQDAP